MAPTLDAVGLVAADLPASLAFYRRLGLDVPAGGGTDGHVEAVLPGGVRIMWDTPEVIRSFDPGWTPGTGHPRVSLAFRCADAAEVDAVYAELTAAGHHGHKEPWDAPWGMRYAVLRDPDGNGVDLYAPL